MKSLLGWFFEKTKVGQVFNSAAAWLSGVKTYLAALAVIIPPLLAALNNFADQGSSYLPVFYGSPEWNQLAIGFGMIFGRAAIAKIGKTDAGNKS